MNRKELREEKIRRRIEYDKLYRTKILPTVDKFEDYRKKQALKLLICYILISTFFIISFLVFLFYFLKIDSTIIKQPLISFSAIVFMVSGILSINIKNDYSKTLKSQYSKDILSLFDNISSTKKSFSDIEIERSCLFTSFNERENDDSFVAKYKSSDILISEVHLKDVSRDSKGRRQVSTVFDGVIASFSVNKNFQGNTIISGKGDSTGVFSITIFKVISIILIIAAILNMILNAKDPTSFVLLVFASVFSFFSFYSKNEHEFEKVNLEDPELMKNFNVYTTGSQIEARYLLTPAFIHRFKTLKNVYGNRPIKCAFFDEQIMLAIYTRDNLFEIGHIFKSLKDPSSFYKFYSQISAIFDMVEHLKMYDEE